MEAQTQVNLRSPHRTRTVWACFGAAMTLVTGGLILGDSGAPRGLIAASPTPVEVPTMSIDPREAPLDRSRWKGIVIHHTGTPAGEVDQLEREHMAHGLAGLGYHFLIGNGQGLGDGAVHVAHRWNRQLAGAHVAAGAGLTVAAADQFNRQTIGIALVGNGDRRPFTDRQVRELVILVRALQQELGIPSTAVRLHGDLSGVSSPGKNFPQVLFESQLLR